MKVSSVGCLILIALGSSVPALAQSVSSEPETQIQKGQLTLIPGCGNSGCNAYYNICVDVPKGATPIGITNYFDSFIGWGGFGNPRKTDTGFCATYWQHSHNQARNDSFDVIYVPSHPGSVSNPTTGTSQVPVTEEDFQQKAIAGTPFLGPLGSPSRSINGQYLQRAIEKLRTNPDANIRGIQIDGAEFAQDVILSNTTVSFPVHLKDCHFAGRFVVHDVRFDHSLQIDAADFQKGFEFDNANLKEDLLLDSDPSAGSHRRIRRTT